MNRPIAGVSLLAGNGALVVRLTDDAGSSGIAETIDSPAIRGVIKRRAATLLGTYPGGRNLGWASRPTDRGPEWIAFSALDSADARLASAQAGLDLVDWLGGAVRPAARVLASLLDAGEGIVWLDAADRPFDQVVSMLTEAGANAVLIDPRRWSVTAMARLDSLCRVLQVGLAFDGRGGPVARSLATDLARSLPMATLGVVGAPPVEEIEPWLGALAVVESLEGAR